MDRSGCNCEGWEEWKGRDVKAQVDKVRLLRGGLGR